MFVWIYVCLYEMGILYACCFKVRQTRIYLLTYLVYFLGSLVLKYAILIKNDFTLKEIMWQWGTMKNKKEDE